MFEIFKARKLLRVIEEKFGHTKPWVILCEGKSGYVQMVVKVFTQEHLYNKPRVHSEFAGTWLANEFDLLTPEVGWVDFDQGFLNTLSPQQQLGLDMQDDRLKFGSKVLPSFQHFLPGLKYAHFKKLLPVDRLFAFDNFIRNADRGSYKPNLLIVKGNAYLIDHEFALEINPQTIQDIEEAVLPGKFCSTHIAYPLLSNANSKDKLSHFDDFSEYLRALNLNNLLKVLNHVTHQGYEIDSRTIMEYFKYIKSNPATFINLLKRVL